MNENEFELDGKVYVAVDCIKSCRECAFIRNRLACAKAKKVCLSQNRADKRHVVLVEKQP